MRGDEVSSVQETPTVAIKEEEKKNKKNSTERSQKEDQTKPHLALSLLVSMAREMHSKI